VDFEFRAEDGNRPEPLCMVAQELLTGREIRMWRPELLALRAAPFNTGPDAVFVAYYAAAEMSCFLALGWPPPRNVLDLFAEHR
jgi:DNA polymerase I